MSNKINLSYEGSIFPKEDSKAFLFEGHIFMTLRDDMVVGD
jgi:hypothetical protein